MGIHPDFVRLICGFVSAPLEAACDSAAQGVGAIVLDMGSVRCGGG
jgi:hypothetical protein